MTNTKFTASKINLKIFRLIFTLTIFLCYNIGFSQDLIKLKSGKIIKARLIEVFDEELKYKKHSKYDERFHTIARESVVAVNYENGKELIFGVPEEVEILTPRSVKVSERLSMTSLGFGHRFEEGTNAIGKTEFYEKLNSHPVISQKLKAGRSMKIAGTAIGIPAGLIFGISGGRWLIQGVRPDFPNVAIFSGLATGISLILTTSGNAQIRGAMNLYNFSSELGLDLKLNQNGVGLAITF